MKSRTARVVASTCFAGLVATSLGSSVQAAVVGPIVNDTWIDGTRTDPASPTYSENGVDTDGDGNLESAWYRGGGGTMVVTNPNPGIALGTLVKTMAAGSSSSWTTYFTPDGAPLTLANVGDSIKITWAFRPQNVNAADTGQGFRMAVVDTPAAARLAADGSPGSSTYSGYGLFGNMNATLSNANPFQLKERTNPGSSTALLSAAAEWTSLANGGTNGATGYASGTLYTMIYQLTRSGANEITVDASMAGGNINGTGLMSVQFIDITPNNNSFAFDTFSLRPSTPEATAGSFETTLFNVEFIPEPSSAMLALGLGGLVLARRKR